MSDRVVWFDWSHHWPDGSYVRLLAWTSRHMWSLGLLEDPFGYDDHHEGHTWIIWVGPVWFEFKNIHSFGPIWSSFLDYDPWKKHDRLPF